MGLEWKARGEVPDSDEDDEIDTIQKQPRLDGRLVARDLVNPSARSHDVWSITSSPAARSQAAQRSLENLPQHTEPNDKDFVAEWASSKSQSPKIEPPQEDRHSSPTAHDVPTSSPLSSIRSTPTHVSWLETNGAPRSTTPVADEALPKDPLSPISDLQRPSAPSTAAADVIGIDLDQFATFQHAARSLRPRKPIQQHPYILENAQYSGLLKKHGLQPVRMPAESSGLQQNQDSQEQEFRARRDSQPRNAASPPLSTQFDLHDDRDDIDELAMSVSPELSPAILHALSSSDGRHTARTEDTSASDDDLPTLMDVGRRAPYSGHSSEKRRRDAVPSSPRKRIRVDEEIASSPPVVRRRPRFRRHGLFRSPSPLDTADDHRGGVQGASSQLVEVQSVRLLASPDLTQNAMTERETQERTARPLTLSSDSEDAFASDLESALETAAEPPRQRGHITKGVLPASYLRLDNQLPRPTQPAAIPSTRVDRGSDAQRKGLAQITRRAVRASPNLPNMLEDETDDDSARTPLSTRPAEEETASLIYTDFDDSFTVTEHDVIDVMAPSLTRRRGDGLKPGDRSVRGQQRASPGASVRHKCQTLLALTAPRTSHGARSKALAEVSATTARPRRSKFTTRGRPSELSIADMVDNRAPHFMRIAARTAKRRRGLGRSLPHAKHICIGDHEDNGAALVTLHKWKLGYFKQNPGLCSAQRRRTDQYASATSRQPLWPASGNQAPPRAKLADSRYAAAPKQTQLDSFVSVSDQKKPASGGVPLLPRENPQRTSEQVIRNSVKSVFIGRTAQLHAPESESVACGRVSLRHKIIDALHGKQRVGTSGVSTLAASRQLRSTGLVIQRRAQQHQSQAERCPSEDQVQRPRRRLIKQRTPRRVDIHLSVSTSHAVESQDAALVLPMPSPEYKQTESQPSSQPRLMNLGQFGASFPTSFNVLPLREGVYFHESTVVGNGMLKVVVGGDYMNIPTTSRPSLSFMLFERRMHWGVWNDGVSTELGQLCDWLTESLFTSSSTNQGDQALITEAVDFMLCYVVKHVSFAHVADEHSFGLRILNLLSGLSARLPGPGTEPSIATSINHASSTISSRLLLVAFRVWRQATRSSAWTADSRRSEEVLKALAESLLYQLVSLGLDKLRSAYTALHEDTSFRDRGIRDDDHLLVPWVVVIQVLEAAQIPRYGVWNAIETVLTDFHDHRTYDRLKLDSIWHDLLTILPLGEFDVEGVIKVERRFSDPLQGWSIPQKLVRHVFGVGKANEAQSSNFAEYCRSLLRRCHHLMREWGWRDANSILGAVFDIFGSQQLANLRNEITYKSPGFLENLASSPSLLLEADDKAFHIFLKMLALALQHSIKQGRPKYAKNLTARVVPNHDRHYSEDQDVLEFDLGALRNHHDLLCTLYWAAPADSRPAIQLLEQLIVPGDSHKAACLINMHAWRQLAIYDVATKDGRFGPLMTWQVNFATQILHQYNSAASDVQQQFLALSEINRSRIEKDGKVESTVAGYQAVAKDLWHFSLKASVDVMKRCSTLETALNAFNTYQLQETFRTFVFSSQGLDSSILDACYQMIEHFADLLRSASDEQYSSEFDDLGGRNSLDDSIKLLNEKIASGLFETLKRLLETEASDSLSRLHRHLQLPEKGLVLAGKVASLLLQHKIMELDMIFGVGRYALFSDQPSKLSPGLRRYLRLLIATLISQDIFDFGHLQGGLLELWMSAMVETRENFGHEEVLAGALAQLKVPFIKCTTVRNSSESDYERHRDQFADVIRYIRATVRDADPAGRQQLRSTSNDTLTRIMQQMKAALKAMIIGSREHECYVLFVRDIIGLIKSHGADVCKVDDYFLEPHTEFGPAPEDPQLHAASIQSYGLRLEEGEVSAIPRLFHSIVANVTAAIGNDTLDAEISILQAALRSPSLLRFALQYIIPAAMHACKSAPAAWLMLRVAGAVSHGILGEAAAPLEIRRDQADLILAIYTMAPQCLLTYGAGTNADLTAAQMQCIIHLMTICNSLRPAILLITMQASGAELGGELTKQFATIDKLVGSAKDWLANYDQRTGPSDSVGTAEMDRDAPLAAQLSMEAPRDEDHHVVEFSRYLEDIFNPRKTILYQKSMGLSMAEAERKSTDTLSKAASDLERALATWRCAASRSIFLGMNVRNVRGRRLNGQTHHNYRL